MKKMNGRLVAIGIFLSALIFLFGIGCAPTIPYHKDLKIDVPATQKKSNIITIKMTEEQRHLIIEEKPQDLKMASSYSFHIGEFLESNLISTLQNLFDKVQVSSQSRSDLTSSPYILETELINHNYNINFSETVFGTHTVKLTIRYSLYQADNQIFTIETDTDGSGTMTSHEKTMAMLPIVSLFATGGKEAMSRAYDEALKKSLNELVIKIQEVLPKN